MITKPFIERFKQSSKAAREKNNTNNAESNDSSKKFLPLFQKLNQIPSDKFAEKKLADCLFQTFQPSFIIVAKNIDFALKLEHIWKKPMAADNTFNDNEVIGKPASLLCDQVKNSKQMQFQNDVTKNYPSDPVLRAFNTQTYTGFPLFDENNNISYVISLITTAEHATNKSTSYSKFELDLIYSVVQRIGRELDNNTNKRRQTANKPNASIEQLKTELEVANKSLESLSYAISHDLRAPLRTMDSFSLILADDFASELPDEAIAHLSRIRRSAKSMSNMIEDLLWLTKVTRRKLEKQKVDLNKVSNNALNDIKEKHSEYTCQFHSDPHLMVNADKNLIKIAMQHLLNNACKFSQKQEKVQISLTHFEKDGETVYKLSDNGCGFDMTYYDQLFEPFKKLHEEDEYKKGTGIGLATVKRIIQRHGGKIWAESEINEGTSIYFTLGIENS